jgi:hypothetical protein
MAPSFRAFVSAAPSPPRSIRPVRK